jgi:hypothetical protein
MPDEQRGQGRFTATTLADEGDLHRHAPLRSEMTFMFETEQGQYIRTCRLGGGHTTA